MKILHIIPNMHTGGAEKFCVDLCNQLAQDESHEVILCSIAKMTTEQNNMHKKINSNVRFISLDREGKNPIFILKIVKMLFSIKPDITHTHTRAQYFSALGLLLCRTPNVHSIHSIAHKEATKLQLNVYKFLYKFFDFTPISISDRVLDSTKKFYGKKFDVKIDNGTKELEKTDKYHEVKQFVDSLKKDENTKIFISMGRFYKVKNQELLIDAFEALLEDGIDAHLIILGSLDVVPEYAKLCQNKIKTPSRIHVLGEKENVSDYLLESDALCFSSLYEGLPIAIIEAMSIGVPTVSTPVGGIPDLIIDEKNGYLSHDMSINSYKETLKKIVFSKTIDKQELISHFNKYYTIELCAKLHLNLYKEKVLAHSSAKKLILCPKNQIQNIDLKSYKVK